MVEQESHRKRRNLMKFRLDSRKPFLYLIILFFFLSYANASKAEETQCPDVWERGHLNVLTINLTLFEILRRDERLERLAEFASTNALAEEPIDVILLQEGVAGSLVGTGGSPRDLRDKLRERGLVYDLKTEFEAGIPGILTTENAILSRCEIKSKFFKFLPLTSEQIEIEGFGDLVIPISRNVMLARIKIPGAPKRFRKINIYNTHLCAGSGGSFAMDGITVNATGCTVDERDSQVVSLLKSVKKAERFFSFFRDKPHVLGGDFNIDNFRGGEPEQFGIEKPLYDSITNAGFIDAYAKSQMDNGIPLEELCVRREVPFGPFLGDVFQDWEPDAHCTTGVSFLDLVEPDKSFEEFFDSTPRRIDYVFQKGFDVESGEVVFNPNASPPEIFEPIVSDHAGVLVRILLQ